MNSATPIGSYDYIIIGGGTAGCVLANRLSADPDISVLMLEAGGKDNYLWIHIPVGYLYCIGNPRTDWCFKTEPEPGLNGRAIGYPRGRVLGGSSSINGMIYMRGQARDFAHWQALGNPGWGWDDVLPYYKRSEDYARGADEMHNSGGEWRVEQQRLSWEILDAFRDAAAEVGIPKVIDFNRGSNEGCGYFEVNQKRGVRWNAAKGFLRPALQRPNLKVITNAAVRRLRFAGKRVIGVEFWQGDQAFQADARL
ncbi:MAG TPA: GMC family oxidoreductase, partial [Gallionella sp.]|nr:GMC family oxidoreductase [Gallionella sp.]